MNAMEKRYTFELVLNLDNKYYTTNLMAGYGSNPDNAMDNLKAKLNNQFMFTLTEEEVDAMVSQNAIPSKQLKLL